MTHSNFPIVVLISGNGSNLQAIIDAIEKDKLSAHIVAVISNQSNAYGLERAKKYGIPTEVMTGKAFPSREAYDQALQACIEKYQPKLIVLAGFMRILGPEIVRHYESTIINIHPSLLPKYRGLHTHEKVLANGDQEHGLSIHFVTEELDGGPIIFQARLAVQADDTIDTLKQRIHILEHEHYPEVIEWIASGRLEFKNQTIYLDGKSLEKDILR